MILNFDTYMKYLYLIFILNINTSLLSWHYNCYGDGINVLFDNMSISGKPFLLFSYNNTTIKLDKQSIREIPTENKHIIISARCDNTNFTTLQLKVPQDDSKNYIDFSGQIILANTLGHITQLELKCFGQKVIY